jgi:hypothetical protein
VPGGIYYVALHGNGGQEIFPADADRAKFMELLVPARLSARAQIIAFCLATCDARLVVQISDVPVGRLVQRVATRYSRYVHLKYGTTGYLFQHPYRAHVLDGTRDLLEVVRHAHLAGIDAGLADSLEAYPWSSHRAYLEIEALEWLTREPVLNLLGPTQAERAEAYRKLMTAEGPEGASSADRFFRVAAPTLDPAAGTSHHGTGHRGGRAQDVHRSPEVVFGVARAAARPHAGAHRVARHPEPHCDTY